MLFNVFTGRDDQFGNQNINVLLVIKTDKKLGEVAEPPPEQSSAVMSGSGRSMRGVGGGGREGDEAFLCGFWSLKFDLNTPNFQFLANKTDHFHDNYGSLGLLVYLEDNLMKQLRVFQ